MTSYLVYRHGSNAANQSMTQVMPVAIVDAETYDEARKLACHRVHCYFNQFLELVPESELDEDGCEDWNCICEQDAELRAVGEESIIYA